MSEHTDRATQGDSERPHTAGAFDIRTLIALLIGVYGLILTIVGIVNSSDEDLKKPEGTNINLWTGICLLVAAAAFEAWALWRPVVVEPDAEREEDRDERPGTQRRHDHS